MKQTHTQHRDGTRVRLLGTKWCPRCKTAKPLSEFGFRKMKPAGSEFRPQSWCKECR